MCKFGEEGTHPPDDLVTAQFLSLAEPSQLQHLIYNLLSLSPSPKIHSYGWFVSVGLQQLHGIAPWNQPRKQRPKLEAVPAQKPPAPEQRQLLSEEDTQLARELQAQIRSAAAGKAMR